jgi:hypothetical protein
MKRGAPQSALCFLAAVVTLASPAQIGLADSCLYAESWLN